MALVLFKLAIWVVGSCVEVATLVLLRGLVLLVIGVAQLIRLPGQAAEAALEAARGALGSAGEFMLGVAWDAAAATVSALLKLLWSVAAGAAELAASAAAELVEAAREAGEKAVEGAAEAVAAAAARLWDSYVDALGLALENLK